MTLPAPKRPVGKSWPAGTNLQTTNDIDNRLRAVTALRSVALSESMLIEAADYTVRIDELLDLRIKLLKKAAA